MTLNPVALAAGSAGALLCIGGFVFLAAFGWLWHSGRPAVSVEDQTGDEVLEVDPPTSRLYIPRAKRLHRWCVEAYADRRYGDICKTCTPRMGVKA